MEYLPFDHDVWGLGDLPPHAEQTEEVRQAVTDWEAGHGHDIRLKCYPEYGCQALLNEIELLQQVVAAMDIKVMQPDMGGNHQYSARSMGRLTPDQWHVVTRARDLAEAGL